LIFRKSQFIPLLGIVILSFFTVGSKESARRG
jgi:hypothetical protein